MPSTTNGRTQHRSLAERARAHGLRFPELSDLSQDREWVEVQMDGSWKRIRLHDYDQIYQVSGLYESLFTRTLQCNSPVRVVSLLRDVMLDQGDDPSRLRVLDVGAGNGMVGYELQNIGVSSIVGIDIIPEAQNAAERDRSWCYDGYLVADLTCLTDDQKSYLQQQRFTGMTCVAALGFGDIPASAFLQAIDLVEAGGWVAFNIKTDFIQERDDSGFAQLLRELSGSDILSMQAYLRYQHRLSVSGEPLYYVAMVARKERDL